MEMRTEPGARAEADETGRRLVLAVGAIFKNEGPYILEWIAFHRAVGVSRFFIADNGSDDGSDELLAALDRAGVIRHIPFPGRPGEPPQLPAYAEILRRHRSEADWIAFIDADEFLQPAPPERSLLPALAGLDRVADVGAFVVNWAVYGSGGETEARPEPVIERFQSRARRGAGINRHYKSIVRASACAGPEENPHNFRLHRGFRTVHADGTDLELFRPPETGKSSMVRWAPMRLNHYVVKSREEFFERKRRRGRATKADELRAASFFDDHDRNEERVPMAPWLISASRAGKNRILAELRAAGWASPEPPVRPVDAVPAAAAEARGPAQAAGRVDGAEIRGNTLRIRGWAVAAGGGQMAAFLLRAGGRPVEAIETIRRPRPDVAKRVPGAHPHAGFMLTLRWETPLRGRLTLRALSPEGSILDLPVPPPTGTGGPMPASAVPDEPMMPPEGTAAFREAISGTRCYLEYGSGGSTVMALRAGVPDLVTVESDRLWLEAVRARVADQIVPGRHHLQHIDIGPTAQFGIPASEAAWRRFGNYPLEPWKLVRERGLSPDFVLIDGRFRVACLLATLIHAAPGCRIFFDDYAERPNYHRVTTYLEPRRQIARLAEFVVPEDRPLERLWASLVEAIGDPF
jgi:Glycosyl transferase family 2